MKFSMMPASPLLISFADKSYLYFEVIKLRSGGWREERTDFKVNFIVIS